MKVFNTLSEKPWIGSSTGTGFEHIVEDNYTPGKTALKFFLTVVSMLFFLFIITFLSRTQFADFQALAGEPWLPLENSNQLLINTGLILLASILLQISVQFRTKVSANVKFTLITVAMTTSLLFIFGQWQVWQLLNSNGYYVNSNPANSFFYLLTGMHALHLLGGLFAVFRLIYIFYRNNNSKKFDQALQLATTYWHYLLILWIALFGLLTSSTETFKTIAQICGF
ncbi:cytochrome c oxidase subunit 3 [Thalassotalea psychrophila]|uniref:Cytochrome c oxidase subunit 3 n=1 Tax=Thalassotalea psychrophila TaxID=3065647 RepID=A0ABY9TQB1_9GAMM|nr:cytochrome c oxidase subunit 3 [Colwelliaceae bacterium SQ149]